MLTLPTDGSLTVNTYNELTGCLVAYLYDQDSTTLLRDNYGVSCSVSDKTITYNNLTPGKYFLRLNKFSGYGSYWLKTIFTDAIYEDDPGSNDSIQGAQNLPLNDSVMGHIGYYGNKQTDQNDFYYIDIPTEGRLELSSISETSGCLVTYLIDQDSTKELRSTYGYSCSSTNKTLEFNNLAPGRYFIRLNYYSGYTPYIQKNTFTPTPEHIDLENDDSLQVARLLAENDTITAVQGYYGNNYTDNNDWWVIETDRNGKIRASTFSDNTLCEVIYLKDTAENTLRSTYGYSCSVYEKHLESGVMPPGTYYIHANNYSGYGSYELTYDLLPTPKSGFDFIQDLFDVTINNTSEDGEIFHWDFGDGNTSDVVNPKHTYKAPGVYSIRLIAENSVGTDTTIHEVEFKGIQSITPEFGGNTGDVTVSVYGGGFTEISSFWLTDGSSEINPDTSILIHRGGLRGTLDLRDKQPGTFDLIVDYGDGSNFDTLYEAFTVEEGLKADPWVNIVGRDRILFNRWQTYTINYGNNGNIDATGVPLWIMVPRDENQEVRFKDFEINLPESDDPVWEMMLDSIPIYLDVDSFDGEPYKGRIYPLFIPIIPAGQTFSIKLQLKTDKDAEIFAWVSPPLFQSPVNPDVADCIRWAQLKAVANGLIGILNEQLPGVACVNSVLQSLYGMTYGDKQPISSHLWNISRSTFTCAAEFVGPLKAYKVSVAVIELGLDIYDNYNADNECRKPKPDPNDPNKLKDPPFNDKPRSKKFTRAVSSFDPNEIIGPAGYTDNNYVKKGTAFNYTIFFENKETATAPAGEVVVIDTLDKEIFDLSSFELKYMNFGDSTIFIPNGLNTYSIDVDLRPEKPIILRLNASLDTTTGIARWQYISLDTLTMDLTEDPDAGFLPPNVTAPEGEGYVGFKIDLKDPEFDQIISNQAIIYFDANPPILTNIYTNQIDMSAPESQVAILQQSYTDTSFVVNWDGIDDKSGVAGYTIFVSEDDGDYETWIGLSKSTSATFTGKIGSSYKFKSVAVDEVGNAETIPSSPDAETSITVSIDRVQPNVSDVKIIPNPVNDKASVQFWLNKTQEIRINVFDQTGRLVKEPQNHFANSGKNNILLNTSELSQGVYLMEIQCNNNKLHKNFIVIR